MIANMTIARTALLAGLLSLACTPVVLAAADTTTVNGYQVETAESHFNFNSGDFTMPHRVRFYRPGSDVVADRAIGNYKRSVATLSGGVVVHDSGTAPEAGDAGYSGSGQATLTCDQLEIDSKQKVYTAAGHVHFSQAGRTGTADHGILNRSNGMLHLDGNVHLTDAGSTLVANSVDYNLTTKDVSVHGSPSVITRPMQPDEIQRQPQPQRKPSPAPRPSPRRSP